MSNRILNLVFTANTTQAKQAMDEFTGHEGDPSSGGVYGVEASMDSASLAAFAFAGAALAAGDAVVKEIGKYTEYAAVVNDLAHEFSISAEEASFLYAAMEKGDIPIKAFEQAIHGLVSENKEAVVGLGELLAEWEAMPEGAEKATFAADSFGRDGLGELLSWYSRLSEAEKEHFGIQEDGLTLTREMINESEDFTDAIADLTTEWGNFKIEILSGVIPALTDLLTWAMKVKSTMEALGQTVNNALFKSGTPSGITAQAPSGLVSHYGGSVGYVDPRSNRPGGFASGGSFIVGGRGGSDTTPVSFMATPGETVSVGGGTSDMENILSEVRRLVDSLPLAIADAVERY